MPSELKCSLVYFKMRINFLEKEDTDYCVEFLLFVLVLCKTTLPPTTETERRLIESLNFEDSLQSLYARMPLLQGSCTLFHHRANLLGSCTFFSPPCELIKLMHSFFHRRANLSNSCTLFFTAVRTYQTHAVFFSPQCELIRLMHSFFFFSFFTTVRTYQTHTLFFRLLAFRLVSYTCKNIVVLRNRVEGTWRYYNDENYVVQKPCLVYSFG